MMKAFAYLRVSGRGQVDGDGFPRQEKAIREYAKLHSIRVVQWFRDEGISGGTELDDRPALAELVETLQTGDVRLVLIERLDRLARDLMIQESIVADFRRKNFELLSVSEPDLLQSDPMRTAMRQMLGVFAQYERSMIVSKLRGSRERMRAKEGRCEGRKPYGHYPGETTVIARMKELRIGGMAYDRIAATLNEEGLKPRTEARKGSECHWHATAIQRILRRESSR